MSSITISPRASHARPARVIVRSHQARTPHVPADRLRLTRRGRVVLTIGFLMVLGILAVGLGGTAVGTFDRGAPTPVRIVEVQPGQTLYELAGTVAEPGHVNDMIARIEQLNSLSTPVLQIGQKVAVPLPVR